MGKGIIFKKILTDAVAQQHSTEGMVMKPYMTKFLGLRAGKGGDAILSQQLSACSIDGRRRDKISGRQFQVAVILHHAHKFCLQRKKSLIQEMQYCSM